MTGNTGNFNETGDKRRQQQHEQSLEGCAIAGAALKTVLIFFSIQTFRLYWSYNRVIWKFFQTVPIIEM